MGPELGRGSFGIVRLCKIKATGELMACKTLPKNEEALREIHVMQLLSGHPNVVRLRVVHGNEVSFHLVMDLCPGRRLFDSMSSVLQNGKYSECTGAKLIKELITAIKCCHDMGVVHRDIKPENILLTSSGQLKLADFGLSVPVAKGQILSGLVGTPAYMAPEMFLDRYTAKVDVWAAGVILHELLTGMLPFREESMESMYHATRRYVQLDFCDQMWKSASSLAKDLLSRMLSKDPKNRPSPEEILSHPWSLKNSAKGYYNLP